MVVAVNCEELFYGSATVGERGQMVIPAEARAALGIKPGDKLLLMRHPMKDGLVVCKFEALQGFLDEMQASLSKLEGALKEEEKTK